jgi:hypothetical protein
MSVLQPQFESVSGTNDDLEQLNNNRKIGRYNSKIWYAKVYITSTIVYEIYSVDSITGTSSLEEIGNFGLGTAYDSIDSYSFTVLDDDIFLLIAGKDSTAGTSRLLEVYSENGGSTWSTYTYYTTTTSGRSVQVCAYFDLGGTYYAMSVNQQTGNYRLDMWQHKTFGPASSDTTELWRTDYIYQGNVYNSKYYFTVGIGTQFNIWSWNGSTWTNEEQLSLTFPSTLNFDVQLYWKFERVELLLDEDHFYYRENGTDGEWVSFSDTGTTTNGIIWLYDSNGAYEPAYIIWKDTVYWLNKKNIPVPIQETAADAYVGWDAEGEEDAWISDGTDTIYQYTYSEFANIRETPLQTNKRSLYNAPFSDVVCQTEPFEGQFIKLYDEQKQLLIQEYITDYLTTSREYKWLIGNHPELVEKGGAVWNDLQKSVTVSFKQKTIDYILKYVIDNYCSHLWYNAGIDTTVTTKYDIKFDDNVVLDVFRWADSKGVRQTSWEPDFEVFWDEYIDHNFDYKLSPNMVRWGDWVNPEDIESSPYDSTMASVKVIEEEDYHRNVVYAQNTGNQRWVYDMGAIRSSETIDLWVKPKLTTGQLFIKFRNSSSGNVVATFRFYTDGKTDFYGATSNNDMWTYTSIWHHLKFILLQNGTCSVTYNGTTYSITGNNYDFDQIWFENVTTGEYFWVDGIGIVSDGYTVDDNRNNFADYSVTEVPVIKPNRQKYGKFIIIGGYDKTTGKKIVKEKLLDPKLAVYKDEFANETDPVQVQKICDNVASVKGTTIKKLKLRVQGYGWLNPGKEVLVTLSEFNILRETWYIAESNYNMLDGTCLMVLTDAFWQPTTKDKQEVVDRNIKKDVGEVQEDVHSPDGEGTSPAFEKIDSNGNFGANPNVENFSEDKIDGTAANWANQDESNCTSSYQTTKTLTNSNNNESIAFKNVLQMYDNNGSGKCQITYTSSGDTIFSFWFGNSDITKQSSILFYESATRIGIIRIVSSILDWYDGSSNQLTTPVNDYLYHIVCVFSVSDDTVDIYINGKYNSTQSLENNITTEINAVIFNTSTSDSNFYTYLCTFYHGNTLADAFSSLWDGTLIAEGAIFDGIPNPWEWHWRKNLSAYDFDETDFTVATTWTDFDLSGIVGKNKCMVLMWVRVQDGAASNYIIFRQNGDTTTFARQQIYSIVANVYNAIPVIIETDDDGKIEYYANPVGSSWTFIDVAILAFKREV